MEGGGYRFKKQKLLETSVVAVPANPAAIAMAKSLGVSDDTIKTLFTEEVTSGHNFAPVTKTENNQTGTPLAKPNLKTSNVERTAMSIEKKIEQKK
jgi:hypothetical protein